MSTETEQENLPRKLPDFIRQQVVWADSMTKLYRRFFDHFIYQRTARDEAPNIND